MDGNESEAFRRGMETRRAVLGDEYVDQAVARADAFSWPLQELTTEWCWDATWNRPGLDRRSRSLLNLGMIAALNRPREFRIHVRGAVRNGISAAEIQEVCIQIGTYCGVPAAIEAFNIAGEVLREMGEI